MKNQLILTAALFAAACASAPTSSPETELQTFMDGFVRTWNAHDAAGIARNYYRMGPPVETQTASTQKMFSDLAAQGFDHTDFHDVKICPLAADKAVMGVKFTRLKADGSPMPPGERAITFDVAKFSDGWRFTKLTATDLATPFACPKP